MDAAHVPVLLDGDVGMIAQCVQFSVGLTLHELTDVGVHAVAGSPQRQAQGGCCFPFAVPGVDLYVAF